MCLSRLLNIACCIAYFNLLRKELFTIARDAWQLIIWWYRENTFINHSFSVDSVSDSDGRWLTMQGQCIDEIPLLCSDTTILFSEIFEVAIPTVEIFVSRRSSFERKLSERSLLFHMRCAYVFFTPRDLLFLSLLYYRKRNCDWSDLSSVYP